MEWMASLPTEPPVAWLQTMSHGLMGQLSLEPIFGWWVVVPLIVITLASLWLTLSTPGISRGGRAVLAGLRLAATLILLLGWLRPAVLKTTERETEGAIAVLMDRSLSMTLPSDTAERSRWEVQQQLWREIADSTQLQLGGSTLVPYFYDAKLVAADATEDRRLDRVFSTPPGGRATDLGKALSDVGRMQLTPPLRGVIVMGDAAQTLVPPQADPILAARQMAQLDQPLMFIGIGPRGESSQMRDIAIEGMPEQVTAFVKKEISVPLVVAASGMQNQPVQLSLTLRASGKPDQVVGTRTVLATQSSEKLPVEFRVVLPEEGEFLLVANASVDTNEQITTNNQATGFVTVREGGVKILYLEGEPRFEQLFLKRSLNESLDFDVTYRWFRERDRKDWPVDISREIPLSDFDVFVIGDLDARVFTDATMQAIARRVNQGAGLLMLGGYHSFDAGNWGRSPLAKAIPIQMNQPPQAFDAKINNALHVLGDVRLMPTRPHPITNLLPAPDNERLWRTLKPLQGMNRFGEISSSPATQVLLESQDGDPTLVTGGLGQGRTLAFAGDTTYQWFMAGEDSGQKRAHQQFWRQAVLWLVRRDSLHEGFRLSLDSRRQEIDATPKINIEWFGGSDNNPKPQQVKLTMSRDGAFVQTLEPRELNATAMEAVVTGLSKPGLYRVALTATSEDGEDYESEIAFIVHDQSRELSQPAADWQLMNNLIAANQAAAGEFFLPEQLDQAIQKLRDRQNAAKITTIERRRLGDAAWDSWLFLVLFCALMSAEWGLRKAWQLP